MAEPTTNLLDINNEKIVEIIKKHNKDYMRVYSGYEGDGKTLLACKHALAFNPDFDTKTQAIYSLKQLLTFQNLYEKIPGKVAFLDEAVLQLLGEDSMTKEAKNVKKMFITHRDRGHIYLLCSPSPWLMAPYIREWRVRDCIIIYTEQFSPNLDRRYAYYTKHEYAKFIANLDARKQIVLPADFVQKHKPAFDEPFKMVTDNNVLKVYKEMSDKKLEMQRELRKEIEEEFIEAPKEYKQNLDKAEKAVKIDIAMRLWAEKGWQKKDAAEFVGCSPVTLSLPGRSNKKGSE